MICEKFPISIVDDLDLPWSAIHDEHIDTDDGEEKRFCVFEHEGRFWRLNYTQTMLDGIYWNNWDRRPEYVECFEVEPKIVEVTKWVAKDEEVD